MRIAYIGPGWGTSLHRAKALERLGHTVALIDPWSWLAKYPFQWRIHYHTNFCGVDWLISKRIYRTVFEFHPDLIWINNGEFLGRNSLDKLRNLSVPVVNYSTDNPFTLGAQKIWNNFLSNLDMYDLIVQTFRSAVDPLRNLGAKKVMRVFLSADEIAHRSSFVSKNDITSYSSDVSYIAQWTPERGRFMLRLSELGVPVSIWGDRWNRAEEWPQIKHLWRGSGMFDDGYRKVIQLSKLSLCLLYKAAGNLHTNRSIEIPSIGTALCAERSEEHDELYKDRMEALLFDSPEECAELCKELLADEPRRREIARRGHDRTMKNNLFNEPILRSILNEVNR